MSKVTKEAIAATDELLRSAGASPTVGPATSKTPLPLDRPSTAQATAFLSAMNDARFGILGSGPAVMGGQDVDEFLGMDAAPGWKPRSVLPPMDVEASFAAVMKVDPRWEDVTSKIAQLKKAAHYYKYTYQGLPSTEDPKFAGLAAFGALDGSLDSNLAEAPPCLLELSASSYGFLMPENLTVDKQARKLREVFSTGSREMLAFFKAVLNNLQQVASSLWALPFFVPAILDDTIEGPWKNSKTIPEPVGIRAGLSCLLDPSLVQFGGMVSKSVQPLVVAGLVRENIAAFALNLDHPDIIKIADDLKDTNKTDNAKKDILMATILAVVNVLQEAQIDQTTAELSFLFDKVQRISVVKDLGVFQQLFPTSPVPTAVAPPQTPPIAPVAVSASASAAVISGPKGAHVPPSPESAFRSGHKRAIAGKSVEVSETQKKEWAEHDRRKAATEAILKARAAAAAEQDASDNDEEDEDQDAESDAKASKADDEEEDDDDAGFVRHRRSAKKRRLTKDKKAASAALPPPVHRFQSVGEILDEEGYGAEQGTGAGGAGGAPSFSDVISGASAGAAAGAPSRVPITTTATSAADALARLLAPDAAPAAVSAPAPEKRTSWSSEEHGIFAHDRVQTTMAEIPWTDIHNTFQASSTNWNLSFNQRTIEKQKGTVEGRHLQLLSRIRDMLKARSHFGVQHSGKAGGQRDPATVPLEGQKQEVEAALQAGISAEFFFHFTTAVGRASGRQTVPASQTL